MDIAIFIHSKKITNEKTSAIPFLPNAFLFRLSAGFYHAAQALPENV
jgi:hypothetical protein